ncbi:MAG TPA: SRPBCC family protein [Noviherbaspirillum sp.]|nr:SRPBCC family protein [Noviherbaspirillum sp.]
MKFAHLIEINDPRNPLIDPLSRSQLWRGLVLRATQPEAFVPQLDRCTLLEQSGLHLVRELQYGDIVLRDNVRFLPQQQVIYEVPAQEGLPPSRLTMTIEEPESGALFVRFEYETESSAEQDAVSAMYDDFRRSAYKESDLDTVRGIRELADAGRLGQ